MDPKAQAKALSKAMFDACLNKGGKMPERGPKAAPKFALEAGCVVAS